MSQENVGDILVSTTKVMKLIEGGDTDLLAELLVKMMGADAGLNANLIALNNKIDAMGQQIANISKDIDEYLKKSEGE